MKYSLNKALFLFIYLMIPAFFGCTTLSQRLTSDTESVQKTAYSDFVRMSGREQDKFIDKCIKIIIENNITGDKGEREEYVKALIKEREANIRALGKIWNIKASSIIDKMQDMDLWNIHTLMTHIFASPDFINSLDGQQKKPASMSIKKLVDMLISKDLDFPATVKKPLLNELFRFFGETSAEELINTLRTAPEKSDTWNNSIQMLASLDPKTLESLTPEMYEETVPLLIKAIPLDPAGGYAVQALEKIFANDYVINSYTARLEEVLHTKDLGYKSIKGIIGIIDTAGTKAKLGARQKDLALFKKKLKDELTKTITDDVTQFNTFAMRLKAMEGVIKYQTEQKNTSVDIQKEVGQFNKYRDEVYFPALKKISSELKDYFSMYGMEELKDLAVQYGFPDLLEGLQKEW